MAYENGHTSASENYYLTNARPVDFLDAAVASLCTFPIPGERAIGEQAFEEPESVLRVLRTQLEDLYSEVNTKLDLTHGGSYNAALPFSRVESGLSAASGDMSIALYPCIGRRDEKDTKYTFRPTGAGIQHAAYMTPPAFFEAKVISVARACRVLTVFKRIMDLVPPTLPKEWK